MDYIFFIRAVPSPPSMHYVVYVFESMKGNGWDRPITVLILSYPSQSIAYRVIMPVLFVFQWYHYREYVWGHGSQGDDIMICDGCICRESSQCLGFIISKMNFYFSIRCRLSIRFHMWFLLKHNNKYHSKAIRINVYYFFYDLFF